MRACLPEPFAYDLTYDLTIEENVQLAQLVGSFKFHAS